MTGGSAPGGAAGEPLGTARQEAARLLEALADWASGAGGAPGSAFTAAREHLGGEGIATGSTECRLCPLCQGIAVVRGLRPEVVEHLLDAGGSLLAALRAGLEVPDPPHPTGEPPGDQARHHATHPWATGRLERIDIG